MIADTIKQITDLAERLANDPECLIVRAGLMSVRSTKERFRTIIVLPGGELILHPGFENVFPDVPLDPTIDPYGWGNGLIVLGKFTAIGTAKTPFRRSTSPDMADWLPTDKWLLPDSRMLGPNERGVNYRPQWEIVAQRGQDYAYQHPMSRDGMFDWHIANLTRDIVFRSENPAGNRAHIWFGHRAEINVRNCEFRSTGRTTVADVKAGRLGRYPVHFHRLWGPRIAPSIQRQFTFSGNSIWCELTPEECEFPWGIVLHDSHYGEVKGNVVHNWHGAGVMVQGNSFGNLIEENLVSGIHGEVNPRDQNGLDASGFWFRNPFNFVRRNVAAGIHNHFSGIIPGVGYQLFVHPAENMNNFGVPRFPGADMENLAETLPANAQTYTPSRDWWQQNEAYGCATGLTFWNFKPANGPHVYASQVSWNCHDEGVYLYPHTNVEFPDNVAIGCGRAMRSGDYRIGRWRVPNPRWLDVGHGIDDSTCYSLLEITGGKIVADAVGVLVQSIAAPGQTWPVASRRTFIDGTDILAPKKIAVRMDQHIGKSMFFAPDEIEFRNVNGRSGRIYYPEQHADFVITQTMVNRSKYPPTAPIVGLTNAQALAQHGICVCGVIAPTEADVIAGFGGLVRFNDPPQNQPPLVEAGPDQTIQWPASTATLQGIISDDSGTFTSQWTGNAAIDRPENAVTQVSFGGPGIYVFRLEATDGTLGAFDTVTVTVLPPPPEPEPETVVVSRAALQNTVEELDLLAADVRRMLE